MIISTIGIILVFIMLFIMLLGSFASLENIKNTIICFAISAVIAVLITIIFTTEYQRTDGINDVIVINDIFYTQDSNSVDCEQYSFSTKHLEEFELIGINPKDNVEIIYKQGTVEKFLISIEKIE